MIAGERSRMGERQSRPDSDKMQQTGGVTCCRVQENSAAHVKTRSRCGFRKRPPSFIGMKHAVLRKGGMYLEEESCSSNKFRMGNTSKTVSTSVY